MVKQSKTSVQKQLQGFVRKPEWPVCSTCIYYQSHVVTTEHAFGSWTDESGKRCSLGGFAVGKTSTCNMHESKGAE